MTRLTSGGLLADQYFRIHLTNMLQVLFFSSIVAVAVHVHWRRKTSYISSNKVHASLPKSQLFFDIYDQTHTLPFSPYLSNVQKNEIHEIGERGYVEAAIERNGGSHQLKLYPWKVYCDFTFSKKHLDKIFANVVYSSLSPQYPNV